MGNKLKELEFCVQWQGYDLDGTTETQSNDLHDCTGDIVVGVCCTPPDQEEAVEEAFYKQLEVGPHLQVLVLMGDFNYPNICWRNNTARHKQSRGSWKELMTTA